VPCQEKKEDSTCIIDDLIFFPPIGNAFFTCFDDDSGCDSGGNADYTMDMHQKEQLHDNTISVMQSQHFSVSLLCEIEI